MSVVSCRVCLTPEYCDCICATCMDARNAVLEMAEGKSNQYAEAHDIPVIELKMLSHAEQNVAIFIIKWVNSL